MTADNAGRKNRLGILILFMALVLGGGLALGAITVTGGWYEGLAKPSFNPPNWVFGPAWTILYVLIAIAGWRTFERARSGGAMKLWWTQLALNFLWTPVYFGAHQIGIALVVILALLVTILAFIRASWTPDRVAAGLFLPYAAWVAFASLLNASIWVLN
jgi:tryptophan-rich sensory protein